jgi:hypothetical protein
MIYYELGRVFVEIGAVGGGYGSCYDTRHCNVKIVGAQR